MRERIVERLRELHPAMIERRRDLHRHPELAFEEHRTSAIVQEELRKLGLEVRSGVARTGVIGRIRGKNRGKTIALRADMDALPIQDAKVGHVDYASETPNKMHACGHDAHVTMLLGAATVLSEMRDELAGDVVLLFQPAEEGVGGAEPMIAQGALEGVDFILGQHMMPLQPAGDISLSVGAAMAAADAFKLRIVGRGGHGAYPHAAIDAVQVAAQVVVALQAIVSRTVDPLQSAVLSIGTVHGGYNFNVVADVVEMKGTVRTFDAALREVMPKRIEAIARGVCEGFGARAELEYDFHYPPVINHDVGVDFVRTLAADALGADHVRLVAPSMGGEDFSYYLQKVPGCFYFVGCRAQKPLDDRYFLHHPAFDMDEGALLVGARLYAEGAMRWLESNS